MTRGGPDFLVRPSIKQTRPKIPNAKVDGDVTRALAYAAEIETDSGDIAAGQRVGHARIELPGENRRAGDLQSQQPLDAVHHARRILVGVEQRGLKLVQQGLILKRRDGVGEKRIANVRDSARRADCCAGTAAITRYWVAGLTWETTPPTKDVLLKMRAKEGPTFVVVAAIDGRWIASAQATANSPIDAYRSAGCTAVARRR